MNKILTHTPLNVASQAIRTCWQSFEKSDNGGKIDLALIDRIGNKFKHASTLEHVSIIGESDSDYVLNFFRENPFSKVLNNTHFITNLRVILENKELVLKLVPELLEEDFAYLIRNDEVYPEDIKIADFCIDENKKVNLIYQTQEYSGHSVYTFYLKGWSRALLQELARHRRAGISVKSSRYTLKELKNIEILNMENSKDFIVMTGDEVVDNFSFNALENLRNVLKSGKSNDIAKYCMPESYKTELTWTIGTEELENFLHLRKAKAALWEIRELANEIESLINQKG